MTALNAMSAAADNTQDGFLLEIFCGIFSLRGNGKSAVSNSNRRSSD